jgi:hypothetical protein
MPGSAEEGRKLMGDWIKMQAPRSVLDIGAGSGTYGKLMRQIVPDAYLIGVEAWEPYVARFRLDQVYDQLIVADIVKLANEQRGPWGIPRADVVILGDVLEHMTEDHARDVWAAARSIARKAVYLSIPIIHYPQGHEEGNPYEEHVVPDYTHERVLETFPGITWHWRGTIVGRYEALVGP